MLSRIRGGYFDEEGDRQWFSPEEGDKLVGFGSETKVGRNEMWLEVSFEELGAEAFCVGGLEVWLEATEWLIGGAGEFTIENVSVVSSTAMLFSC